MTDKHLTRSERAINLLKRLLLLSEPGGVFHNADACGDEHEAREAFLAEVMGVVTGPEDPGQVAAEHQLALAKIAMREARAIMLDDKIPLTASHLRTGMMLDMALHVLGVGDTGRPTTEEVDKLRPVDICNCEKCRARRAEQARKSGP